MIPAMFRKIAGFKPGDKIIASILQTVGGTEIRLKPGSVDWVRRLAGTAKGVYGDVEKYIEHERNSWDRSQPWP